MGDEQATLEGSQPLLSARQAALAYIAERRRQDPNWNHETDPTYNSGPNPAFVQMMTDAEYDRHMADRAGIAERRKLASNPNTPRGALERVNPQLMPRRVVRAALPFGQRIRDVRTTLGWTQRDIAARLGVSRRTIIRYEQGRSTPLRSAPFLALRRLEAVHGLELGKV